MEQINVLCLHGCNQQMDVFKGILKEFIRIGNNNKINFFFAEAKYDHPDGGKTWYNVPLAITDIGNIKYNHEMVIDTLDYIDELITKYNINVLLGFSQGGNVVDTYLGYRKDARIKFSIIFSGYSLTDPNRTEKLNVPIMNVLSKADDIVPYMLAPNNYQQIKIIEHDKGHKLPTSKPVLREIIKFICDIKILP